MTPDLQKNVIFELFTCFQPNDWIITFYVSWCHIMMISCHFKGFCKNKKNGSFRWPRTCRTMWFLDILHFCRFCSQMSEFLHFSCPDVVLWWFPAILRAFEKIKKMEVFDDCRPAQKCDFWTFDIFADFATKSVNYYILGVLMSYYFKDFWQIVVFDDRGPAEKWRFLIFHTFADLAAKWVHCYILCDLMSYFDDFLPF